MDIKELFINTKETVTSHLEPLIEKVQEFYEENKKLSFIILGLIAVLLICIILLISLTSKKKKDVPAVPGTVLELTETPYIPDGPELPKDYTASRTVKDKWTEDEAKEWFTVPSQKEIDSLSKANDMLINEITGAAP